jgi:hypothetical protein
MWVKWKCRRIAACLWEYSNGELPTAEKERVRIHLMECPSCRVALEAARCTAPLVASLRDAMGPSSATNFQDLIVRLEARQRQSASPIHRASRFWQLAIVGAALAGVVLIAVHADKQVNAPENAIFGANRTKLAEGEKNLPLRPEGGRFKPLESTNPAGRNMIVAAHIDKKRQDVPLHVASVSHRARTWAGAHRAGATRIYAAVQRRSHAAPAVHVSAGNDTVRVAALRKTEDPQSGADVRLQSVMMPLVGSDEQRGLSRAFVIDRIPTTTLTGQAGTVAAEAQNPETGRAL